MAYPGSPPKGPAPFEKAPLTPGDFDRLERLATAFRPSWELDDAPFTGAGSLSAAEIQALQGGGTRAEVRAALLAAQTGHAPAKAATVEEPAHKVIVDPAMVAPPSAPTASRPAEARPAAVASPGPWAAPSPAMPPLAAPSPQSMRRTDPPAAPRRPAPAMRSSEPSLAAMKKSRTGLFVGAGAGLLVLVGAIVWLSSGSSEKDKPVAAPAETLTAKTTSPAIPPPNPELANNTSAPSTPAAAHVAAAPPAQAVPPSPPVIAATALPQAPVQHFYAAPARPAAAAGPASKPATASRAKGPTIVRDVPF
jgi:hypothetical protein